MKILISAYACSPYKGSEPGVGWGFLLALAHQHDLWIIVEEEKFRADIERYLTKHTEIAQSTHFFFLRKKRNRLLRASSTICVLTHGPPHFDRRTFSISKAP